MEEYIKFIQDQVKRFQEFSRLSDKTEITPFHINTVLAHYTNVGVALIGEYHRSKIYLYNLNKEYKKWHNKKFYEVRRRLTSEFEGKTIKLAVKEIDNAVEVEYEKEYWEWQDRIQEQEMKVSFLRGLIDQWAKLDNVLNNLGKNMRQEMVSLSVENRINKIDNNPPKVRTEFPQPKRKPVTNTL